MEVEVYTLAFRSVIHQSPNQPAPGGTFALSLTDDWGKPLSDGLYYVVLKSAGKGWVGKLLVLR
jgi:hypothetical protein